MDNSKSREMSHFTFDQLSQSGVASNPYAHNALVPQDQTRTAPTPFSSLQSSAAPTLQLKDHQHYDNLCDGVLFPSLPHVSTGESSNVNTGLVHHDVLATLGDSNVISAPPYISSLLAIPPSQHDLSKPRPQSSVLGQQLSMKEPENPALTFSFDQSSAPPNLPPRLMPNDQHKSNSVGDAALFPSPQQVITDVGSYANIGFPHDVFAHLDDTNAMAVPRQGRQRLQPHHIPSLPGMPQNRHELREPLAQSTLLGQLPSMKYPDNSATPFPFRPLFEPNLPNSWGDATISASSSQVSTGTGCIANTGLPHDVFASSSGSDVLLSPLLARDPQPEQQHLHTSQLPSLPEMLPNQHDLHEPLPRSNLLGQQLSTEEPAKSANAKLVCPECKTSCSYPSELKRHMTVHTGEKPYRCTECGNAFSRKSSLTVHIRKHAGEKP